MSILAPSLIHMAPMATNRYAPSAFQEESCGRLTCAQQIEHAGYTRYILDRNPRRYNEYGDELEDSESDPEADADAEGENPYSNVHLEGSASSNFRRSGTLTDAQNYFAL